MELVQKIDCKFIGMEYGQNHSHYSWLIANKRLHSYTKKIIIIKFNYPAIITKVYNFKIQLFSFHILLLYNNSSDDMILPQLIKSVIIPFNTS